MRHFYRLGSFALLLVLPLASCASEEQAVAPPSSTGSGAKGGTESSKGNGSASGNAGTGSSSSSGSASGSAGTGSSSSGGAGMSGAFGGSAGMSGAFGGSAGMAGSQDNENDAGSGGTGTAGASGDGGSSSGPCTADCPAGSACTSGSMCSSGQCLSNKCAPDHCGDAMLSDDESDVDCGGSCQACAVGKACNDHDDCADKNCVSGTCAAVDHCLFDWQGRCGQVCSDAVQSDQRKCIDVLNCLFENRDSCSSYSACTSSPDATCGGNTLQASGAAYDKASAAYQDCCG